MSKGSPQAQPTTTTVNQNKLPEYAQPYVEQALAQGQALAQNAYTPYPGEQLAPLAPQQYAAMDAATNLPNATAPTFGMAQQNLSQAAQGGANAAGYNPMMVSPTYQPGQISSGYQATPFSSSYTAGQTGSGYQAGNYHPQSWTDPGVAQSFIDPYQSAVTNETIKQINQQGGLQRAQIQSNAVSAGAFGGDREQVAKSLNDYYTQQAVGQAAAQGAQAAWQSGQNQFNAQQNLGLGAFQQNQQAGQAQANLGLQSFQQNQQAGQAQANLGLQAQQQTEAARQAQANLGLQSFQQNQQAGQAAGQQSLAAQQANQAAAYQKAQLGLQGSQLQSTAGQNLGYLGTSMQNAALQNQQALQSSGAIMQAQQQSADNVAYQDFLNQLNFPYQQVGFQSSIINGLPIGNIGTTASYQNPNTVSQMLGLGLGGLGLSQALGRTA